MIYNEDGLKELIEYEKSLRRGLNLYNNLWKFPHLLKEKCLKEIEK